MLLGNLLFNQMEMLEKNLNAVQDEIRQCIEDVRTVGQEVALVSEMREDEKIESNGTANHTNNDNVDYINGNVENEEKHETEKMEKLTAQFSKMLTENVDNPSSYQMQVYHYWQGAKSGSTSRASSAGSSRPSSGHPRSRPQSGQKVKMNSSTQHDITTYSVTMMNEGTGDVGVFRQQPNHTSPQVS